MDRWLRRALVPAATAYLVWRTVAVTGDPSVAAVALLAVELLALAGLGAFVFRTAAPTRPRPANPPIADRPAAVLAVLAGGRSAAAIERTLASIDHHLRADGTAGDPDASPRLVVVDEPGRSTLSAREVIDVVNAAGASLAHAAAPGWDAAVSAVAPTLGRDDALVVVAAGSVVTAASLDALLAPMTDPEVGAVQGRVGWADDSQLSLHGPGDAGLDLVVHAEAPAAGAAGIAPLLGDGTALRGRALATIARDRDLAIALAAGGWTARYSPTTVVLRARPASTDAWRHERTGEVVAARRRAVQAVRTPGLRPATRVRFLTGAGDLASAHARLGAVALLVVALAQGAVPVPGQLAPVLGAAGALWTLGWLAASPVTRGVLRAGGRARLGWRRLDADVLGTYVRGTTRTGSGAGRLRTLASFPLSVVALVALDAVAIARGLALVRPSVVPAVDDGATRAVLGLALVVVLASLFDALRLFVARPDGRDDLRVRSGLTASVTHGTHVEDAALVDLSPIGAGLRCAAPLRGGDRCMISVELVEGERPLLLDAVVARVDEERDGRRIGVRFVGVPAATRSALVRYVATTAAGTESARPVEAGATGAHRPTTRTVTVPRPLLRFASVVGVIVTSTSLLVAPAMAEELLDAPATVTGTVVDADGPVASVCVAAVDGSWQWFGTQTDESGQYSMEVPAGSYKVQVRDCRPEASPRFATAWWSPDGLVRQSSATELALAAGDARDAVDVRMTTGGWFTGTLQDRDGGAVDGICVNPVAISTWEWDGGTTTPSAGQASGGFVTDGLLPGQYRLHFNECSGRTEPFVTGWLGADGAMVTSDQLARVFDVAEGPIEVGAVTMVVGTRLAGTVRDDAGAPVPDVCVSVNGPNWSWAGGGRSGTDGTYVTDPLLPGDWVLAFSDCRADPVLINTLWTGTDAVVNSFEQATPVRIDGSSTRVEGIDQTMIRGGRVSGAVRDDGRGYAGVCVNAVRIIDGQYQWLAGTQTQSDGTFTLGPLVGEDIVLAAEACQGDSVVLRGFYVDSDSSMTRDANGAARLTVEPGARLDDLVLRPELGSSVAGRVTSGRAPLEGACVTAVDPATGYADTRTSASDGTWSMHLPAGSYLVLGDDCQRRLGVGGGFFAGAATAEQATRVVVAGGEARTGVDLDLTAGAPSSFQGRVVTGKGEIPVACVIVVGVNQEPVAVVPTGVDGSFDTGPITPGAYMIGIAGCDLAQNPPPGVTDPSDPSVTYPLQWSNGQALDFTNIWKDLPFVSAPAGVATDLGTICLAPCTAPPTTPTTPTEPTPPTTNPPTTTPPTVPPTTTPQATAPTTVPRIVPGSPSVDAPATVGGTVATFGAATGELPVEAAPFPATAQDPSGAAQARRGVAPDADAPATGAPTGEADDDGEAVPSYRAAVADDPAEGTTEEDRSAWWWLFGLASVLGLAAAVIPWYHAQVRAG